MATLTRHAGEYRGSGAPVLFTPDWTFEVRPSKLGGGVTEATMKTIFTSFSRARSRRSFLKTVGTGAATLPIFSSPSRAQTVSRKDPTHFQLACMTLPYSSFPFQRAIEGIAASGYRYVAWGTRHVESNGERVPILDVNDSPARARQLARQCEDQGLTPVMMFSTVYVAAENAVDAHKRRIEQAAEAGIGQLLTFGSTKPGEYPRWIANLREIGPFARDAGVLVVVKQHGGETGTGAATAKIVKEVGDSGVWVNYDAGNVMDYVNEDPIADLEQCADMVRSFCIKDHRNYPQDQDCGPGFGEIDHYLLLEKVAYTGLTMPLAFENIFVPLVPRPDRPEGVDKLAEHARFYIESVINGLQQPA